MKKLIIDTTLFLFLFVIVLELNAQNKQIDSLENLLLENTKSDTTRVNLLNKTAYSLFRVNNNKALQYAEEGKILAKQINYIKGEARSWQLIGIYNYYVSNYTQAIGYYQNAINIYKKIDNKNGIANCLFNMGSIERKLSNFPQAYNFYKEALKINRELNDKNGISGCLNSLGLLSSNQGNYYKALEYHQKALKIREELGLKQGISSSMNNIGIIYFYQKEYDQSLEYYQKSLKNDSARGDKHGIARCLNNIGLVYKEQAKYAKANEYYQKSLAIKKELGDEKGISYSLNNIGETHYCRAEYLLALEYYQKSIKIKKAIGNKSGVSYTEKNIADVYLQLNKYNEALTYSLSSLKVAEELNLLEEQKNIHKQLSQIYAATKKHKKAYENYMLYKKLNDSIFNKENIQKITGLEYQYKYDKEKQAAELEQQKKDAVQAEELKWQKIVRNAFIVGFVLMLLLVLLVYIGFLQKRKANRVLATQKHEIREANEELNQTNEELSATLEIVSRQKQKIEESNERLNQTNEELNATLETVKHQKKVIEESHNNINESISYASRIQRALLPSEKLFSDNLTSHFILYKPKDVVSGDFYYFKKIDNYLIIAAADCTGHGVPGAFVSMLGIAFLNEIIGKKEIKTADDILDKMRIQVKASLKQSGKSIENKDGMDMAICIIDTQTNILNYSGAYSPLYIVRDNTLLEFKATLNPIGAFIKEEAFISNNIQLQKHDKLYIFSDGFQDQFGGEGCHKFQSKRFKEIISSISNESLSIQKELLVKTFEEWKGNKCGQTDDILVIGIEV